MPVWEGSYTTARGAPRAATPPHRRDYLPFTCRLLLGACGPLPLPLRLGPLQQILSPRTAQMRATVLHHHLAIDEAGLVGNQVTREVGEFGMVAMAAERIAMRPTLLAALGPELAGGAGGWKRPRGDRDGANALRAPFH